MSRTSVMIMNLDTIDEEAALERKREEAVKLLSLKLRAEGSQTIHQYCGLTEDGLHLLTPSPPPPAPAPAPATLVASKRLSPASPPERTPSDGPSPEKRSRGESASSGSASPVAPLIKVMGRGRGKKAITLNHARSYISQVNEVAQAMSWVAPVFDHTITGLPPFELFKVTCRLNGQEYEAPQPTLRKQEGKELASLEALRSILGDSSP